MNAFRSVRWSPLLPLMTAAAALLPVGCRSPYYADRGAGVGALGGAGVGAIVGNAVGNTAGGALIGAGVGALGGAAVGSAIDEAQAQNRAELAAVMGRQVQAGAATIDEVVAMSQQGVDQRLISNYVRTSGMARPLTRGRCHLSAQCGREHRRDPSHAEHRRSRKRRDRSWRKGRR